MPPEYLSDARPVDFSLMPDRDPSVGIYRQKRDVWKSTMKIKVVIRMKHGNQKKQAKKFPPQRPADAKLN